MLQHLSIVNYAIISELEITFSPGMNIITGETGAGKSIIIGALNLILGERADSSALVDKSRKCVIEGLFSSENNEKISRFLQENDLDEQQQLLVRREITSNGKSRAFINDTPVNLSQLHALSQMLVDLHQQFDTLSLSDRDFQINVLDALANNQQQLRSYKTGYQQWQEQVRNLANLKSQQEQFEKEADYNRFQYEELAALQLKDNELEELEAELKLLSNAEGIKSALDRSYAALSESEQPITQQLRSLLHLLNGYRDYHTDLAEVIGRLESAQIELDDIAGELSRLNNKIDWDPEKLDQFNERLSAGYKLQKKHGVSSTRELLDLQLSLEEKLQAVLQIGDQIEGLEKATAEQQNLVLKQAQAISEARKKQIPSLEKKVNQLLHQVGMPNARLKVDLQIAAAGPTGIDEISFLFDANKSGQFKPVGKVASGGELSRLMLCIKSLVARKMDLPTLIFDEIDTGISGEAARQVGLIMKDLTANRQIICITHQPQIAGKADAHFFVYKELKADQVATLIRQLDEEQRVTAIAKMLSGEQPTAAAIQNAREMITG
ncbi:DNA repair protein RecN [Niabella terrae]